MHGGFRTACGVERSAFSCSGSRSSLIEFGMMARRSWGRGFGIGLNGDCALENEQTGLHLPSKPLLLFAQWCQYPHNPQLGMASGQAPGAAPASHAS